MQRAPERIQKPSKKPVKPVPELACCMFQRNRHSPPSPEKTHESFREGSRIADEVWSPLLLTGHDLEEEWISCTQCQHKFVARNLSKCSSHLRSDAAVFRGSCTSAAELSEKHLWHDSLSAHSYSIIPSSTQREFAIVGFGSAGHTSW